MIDISEIKRDLSETGKVGRHPDCPMTTDGDFRKELKTMIGKRVGEINHLVSGCNSPFTYTQIMFVQDWLCKISEILGLTEDEK